MITPWIFTITDPAKGWTHFVKDNIFLMPVLSKVRATVVSIKLTENHGKVMRFQLPFLARTLFRMNAWKRLAFNSIRQIFNLLFPPLATLLNDIEWCRFDFSFVLRCKQQCWSGLATSFNKVQETFIQQCWVIDSAVERGLKLVKNIFRSH